VNVVPIQSPPEEAGAKCLHCGASVVADQRYCLTCGQPCSPVRLPFLDVLQAEADARVPATVIQAPVGYLPPVQRDQGALGWLRHQAGLLALLSVLLTTGLIGLLIGHWMAPSKASGPQVVKFEGLPVAGVAANGVAATSPTTSTPAAKTATTSKQSEAQEVKEVKEAESPKKKLPPPVKTSSSTIDKLEKTTGKAHEKEIEKLTEGGQPIETGK
jgi:hypothetical protein